MGDPEMVSRAQRAAARLEQSWDRWRRSHGLVTDRPQPVSSYVGYSLTEPWGQPRVVFGVAAQEAEQLSALLDREEAADPGYNLAWKPEPSTYRSPVDNAGVNGTINGAVGATNIGATNVGAANVGAGSIGTASIGPTATSATGIGATGIGGAVNSAQPAEPTGKETAETLGDVVDVTLPSEKRG
jgi:hypothetical protein